MRFPNGLVHVCPLALLLSRLRIHAMDYVHSLTDPGRDLVAVEVFSGKATLVTSFRPSSKYKQHDQHIYILYMT